MSASAWEVRSFALRPHLLAEEPCGVPERGPSGDGCIQMTAKWCSDGWHWRYTNLDLLEPTTKQARINVRFWPVSARRAADCVPLPPTQSETLLVDLHVGLLRDLAVLADFHLLKGREF